MLKSMCIENWTKITVCISFKTKSPCGSEFEILFLNWYGKLLHLPKKFLPLDIGESDGGACMTSSSAESLLWAISVARDVARNKNEEKKVLNFVAYTSEEGYKSHEHIFKLSGVVIRKLKSSLNGSLNVVKLERALKNDLKNNLSPFFLFGTLCTEGFLSFDDSEELGLIAQKYGMWFHYDMSYGGPLLLVPDMRDNAKGLQFVSSLSISTHDGFTTYNTVCLYTSRLRDFSNTGLSKCIQKVSKKSCVLTRDIGFGTEKPFRSLKLYFVLRILGLKKIKTTIEKFNSLANYAGEFIKHIKVLELIAVKMNAVLFRIKGDSASNVRLFHQLKKSGSLQISYHKFGNQVILRFVIGGIHESIQSVERGLTFIKHFAKRAYRKSYRSYKGYNLKNIDRVLSIDK